MNHNPAPKVIRPFSDDIWKMICDHVRHVRNCFDWPGLPYHDANEPEQNRFNRFYWHNLPMLRELHHDPKFISMMSELFDTPLKPSYVFLSMYGPDGVCPPHTDRPQCQFTVDWQIESQRRWPIVINEESHLLNDGEAICYSGTGQKHYRRPARESIEILTTDDDKSQFFMNLAFFHFVPTSYMGRLE